MRALDQLAHTGSRMRCRGSRASLVMRGWIDRHAERPVLPSRGNSGTSPVRLGTAFGQGGRPVTVTPRSPPRRRHRRAHRGDHWSPSGSSSTTPARGRPIPDAGAPRERRPPGRPEPAGRPRLDRPGGPVHRAPRRRLRPGRDPHRLPDRLRAEPAGASPHARHRAALLRGGLPRRRRVAGASRARRRGLSGPSSSPTCWRPEDARLLLRGVPRPGAGAAAAPGAAWPGRGSWLAGWALPPSAVWFLLYDTAAGALSGRRRSWARQSSRVCAIPRRSPSRCR